MCIRDSLNVCPELFTLCLVLLSGHLVDAADDLADVYKRQFLNDAAAPVMDGSCGAEDYLILQLRLRRGLSLDAYKRLYGKEFSTAQLAFVQNCVRAGYASFDGHTLALTPAGLIVQNSILAQLL